MTSAKAKGTEALTATMTKVAVVETSTWPSSNCTDIGSATSSHTYIGGSPLSSPKPSYDHKRKSKHTAAIAGGVVASILVFIVMVVAIMYCRRKLRCRNRGEPQAVPFLGMSTREDDGASEKDWGIVKDPSIGRSNAGVA
ncbi:hypothetical protein CPB85DRAFT_1330124 [Mucidula mucida]|nr:hypothetical protein CPB85DRAFT_1330124 [Mucidula mucida]